MAKQNVNFDEISADREDFLAEEGLVPNLDKTNTNRGCMWTAHIAQAPVLANDERTGGPEEPLIFTRIENEFGKYSSGYKKNNKTHKNSSKKKNKKGKLKVIKKFIRNENNYFLLVYCEDDDTYDIISREETKWITENYGYRWNNDFLDSLKEGSIIKSNEIYKKNTSYDEYHNLCYGKNMLTMFYAYKDLTHEDAIGINEASLHKHDYYGVTIEEITLNTNNLFLNIYGDDENYKCFPDINEDIVNSELCIRRIIDYQKILTDLRDLKEYRDGDDPIYKSGKVVDIKIYCNANIEEKIKNVTYYEQIYKYIEQERKYEEDTTNYLKKLVEKETDKCSNELINYYNDLLMDIDDNQYKLDDSEFDNIVIEFTLMTRKTAGIGTKYAGRYGNKGVISVIIPEEEVPVITEGPLKGLKPDFIQNPLGITGRMNPSVLIEQEINFIGLYVRMEMKNILDRDDEYSLYDCEREYFTFIQQVSTQEQIESTERYLADLEEMGSEYLLKFLIDNIETGIRVHQSSFFDNMDINKLADVYEFYEQRYGIDNMKCKFAQPNEITGEMEEIYNKMTIGEIYMIRLKHDTSNKSSLRSTGFVDLTDLPAKDRAYKEGKSLYPMTPVKFGEQEVLNSLIPKDTSGVKELTMSYGTSYEAEDALEMNLLDGDPFNVDYEAPIDGKTKTSKMKDRIIYGLGLETVDDDIEGTFDAEEYLNKEVEQLEFIGDLDLEEEYDEEDEITLIECIDEENDIWLATDGNYYTGDGEEVEFEDEEE